MTQVAPPSGSEFRRPSTAQEAVLAELRRLLLEGHLAPGAPIRQDSIAADLGVSRVPVREALKILEGEGQVTYRPHRGYVVTQLSEEDVLEIYRIRDLLESEAIRVGVPRITDEELELMEACLREMEDGDAETGAMSQANARFHLTLLESCGMPRLLKHIRLLRASIDAYRSLYYMSDHAMSVVKREHREILQAAAERDPETVIYWANAHREHTIQALRRLLSKG